MNAIPDTLILKAQKYFEQGKLLEASVLCRKALQLDPHCGKAFYLLGLMAFQQQKSDWAFECFKKALAGGVEQSDCYFLLGNLYLKSGRLSEAFTHYQRAISLAPLFVEAIFNIGVILQEQNKYSEAITHYQRVLQLQSNSIASLVNLGICYGHIGDFKSKQMAYQKALGLRPDTAQDFKSLAYIYSLQCEQEKAVQYCQEALRINPLEESAHSALIFYRCATPTQSQQEILDCARHWGERFSDPFLPEFQGFKHLKNRKGPLRVGIISADFRACAAAFFMMPFLTAPDSEDIEWVIYSGVQNPDEITEQMKGLVNIWRDIQGWSVQQVLEHIRSDDIQILLDPGIGHASGNLLHCFSYKPAPIQVTYYPSTTGMKAMDYRVTDEYFDPPGEPDTNAEKLVYLSRSIFCYCPAVNAPDVQPLPFFKNGYYTLGSFNNLLKLNHAVIQLWSLLLLKLPKDTRLMLKHYAFEDEANQRLLKERFMAQGVASERIVFGQPSTRFAEHLANYHEVDLSLDTFPFNGMTTTCEALWMGVPVVSLSGSTHFGRAGASILSSLGLEEFLADSESSYLEMVCQRLNDPNQLAEFRQTIRSKMKDSPICDSQAYLKEWQSIFQNLWQKWCVSHT